MAAAVLSGFIFALFAPWLYRIAKRRVGWVAALLPIGLTLYFAAHLPAVATGEVITVSHPWAPLLGLSLSFYLDGLSLLFALLISGIGALVLIYAGGYLADHPQLGRFYLFILIFMASMLGVVLAGNLLTLFVFWELTSLSSYLLIGFDHEREAARSAALQALLVTGGGGLALMAGLVLIGQVGESFEFSVLLQKGDLFRSHALYLPILLLVLLGAFTKSAQVPFHFWLPSAMEGPTPVSAYLHSATMVKAGIYLMARLTPLLGGTDAWFYIVSTVGAATMLITGVLAFYQDDLKRILAYSTVSVLGTLTMLLGLGTPEAIKAAIVYLFAHALYKGALFMVAGAVYHETGDLDLRRLQGLGKKMPITAAAGGLAALSMAGIPPMFGFIGKEMLYVAGWERPSARVLLIGVMMLASLLFVAVAGRVGFRPFFSRKRNGAEPAAHEAPVSLWLGPALLGGLGFLFGLFPGPAVRFVLSPAGAAILRRPAELHLALWHGFNPILVLSAAAILAGGLLYAARDRILAATEALKVVSRWGPASGYKAALDGMMTLAKTQTRLLQNGRLRIYLMLVAIAAVGLTGSTLLSKNGFILPGQMSEVRFYEVAVGAMILTAAFVATQTSSRFGAVTALGVVGYGVALIYILYGAPDLAMTQFLIETFTVILFVLVFYYLPRFTPISDWKARARDGVLSLSLGALMFALVLTASSPRSHLPISDFFAEKSVSLAHGRNIVNVILVDFRGFDTLGEITVLAVAAFGVYALLKLRLGEKR